MSTTTNQVIDPTLLLSVAQRLQLKADNAAKKAMQVAIPTTSVPLIIPIKASPVSGIRIAVNEKINGPQYSNIILVMCTLAVIASIYCFGVIRNRDLQDKYNWDDYQNQKEAKAREQWNENQRTKDEKHSNAQMTVKASIESTNAMSLANYQDRYRDYLENYNQFVAQHRALSQAIGIEFELCRNSSEERINDINQLTPTFFSDWKNYVNIYLTMSQKTPNIDIYEDWSRIVKLIRHCEVKGESEFANCSKISNSTGWCIDGETRCYAAYYYIAFSSVDNLNIKGVERKTQLEAAIGICKEVHRERLKRADDTHKEYTTGLIHPELPEALKFEFKSREVDPYIPLQKEVYTPLIEIKEYPQLNSQSNSISWSITENLPSFLSFILSVPQRISNFFNLLGWLVALFIMAVISYIVFAISRFLYLKLKWFCSSCKKKNTLCN